jgi:hypothetical protein
MVYNCFYLCELETKYWLVAFNVSIAIMLGVVALSFLKCTLLQDALDDLGGGLYLIGNFAVHYYVPAKLWYAKPATENMARQITFSLTWLATYLASQRAADVYGCPISNQAIIFASLLCIPLTAAVYAASVDDVRQRVYAQTQLAFSTTADAVATSTFLQLRA